MATFRAHQYWNDVDSNRFEITGSVVEGEITPGMFLRIWFSMMLYYPYRIVAMEPLAEDPAGGVRLTFESEVGEECLLEGFDLQGSVLHVSVNEPCPGPFLLNA